MGRTFLDIDMARAADLLGMDRRQAEMFRDLARGHFVALGPALSRRPLPITIGPVETSAAFDQPQADAAARRARRRARPDLHARPGRGKTAGAPHPAAAADTDGRPSGAACKAETRAGAARRARLRRHRRSRTRRRHRCRDARDPRRPRCRVPFGRRALPGFPGALPHSPRTRRTADAAGLPPPVRGSPRRRRCATAAGEVWAHGPDALGGLAGRSAGRVPGGCPGGNRQLALPIGCDAGARLWQPFATPRPPSARLFRGTWPAGRAHRFPQPAHRWPFPISAAKPHPATPMRRTSRPATRRSKRRQILLRSAGLPSRPGAF